MLDLDPKNESMPGPSGPKLLLADDSPTIRKVVELTFADEGINVIAVSDAVTAMEKFVHTQPDIVLVDINLPGTSGYQICEMIKQDEATASIPVLLLVGTFEPFDQDEAERVRADGFLLKPFKSIKELVDKVRELLSPTADAPTVEPDGAHGATDPTVEASAVDQKVGTPETNDIEALYRQSFLDGPTQKIETLDDFPADAGMDDELIDTSHHSDAERPIDLPSETDDPPFMADYVDPFSTTVKEFSVQRQEFAGSDTAAELDPTLSSPSSSNNPPAPSNASEAFEPTDEFIELVARKVVERLSGREIRDVAREVVPRIAEKLIREALSEEK